MMHDYHEALPGSDPAQLFHDGCAECERRTTDLRIAIAHMDHDRFATAARRALLWRLGDQAQRDALHVADCERELLDVLGLIIERLTTAP